MRLRVGQVERPRADAAMVPTRPCPSFSCGKVDGFRVQALGGVELEHAVGAQHVERADLGHHVLGDLAHDAVKPLLRLERLRHQLAEPFEQNARAGGQVSHRWRLHAREQTPCSDRVCAGRAARRHIDQS